MSGGSWEYVFHHVDDVASRLLASEKPERRALGRVAVGLAKALHDIEWVDSCDYGQGDDMGAIRLALGKSADVLIAKEVEAALAARVKEATEALDKLRAYIAREGR